MLKIFLTFLIFITNFLNLLKIYKETRVAQRHYKAVCDGRERGKSH